MNPIQGHTDRPLRLPRGFSLIEVLITVTIISVTVAVAVIYYNPSESARESTAQAQLDQIRQLVEAYNATNPY